MLETEIEQKLQAKGHTAPRLTPEKIDSVIAAVDRDTNARSRISATERRVRVAATSLAEL